MGVADIVTMSAHTGNISSALLILASIALGAMGLLLDVYWLSNGYTSGIPYLVAVILGVRSSRASLAWTAAGVCSLLAFIPLTFLSQPSWPAFANYGIVVFGIWLTATVCLRWRETQTRNQRAEWFHQSIIDALASEVAVIDGTGKVVAVNEAWRRATQEKDGPIAACSLGVDFLKTCRIVSDDEAEEGSRLAVGIRDVLEGRQSVFSLEYLAPSGGRKRWYGVRATRFEEGDSKWAVIEQEETTRRKLADLALERSRANYRELAKRDELTGLYNRRALDEMMNDELNRFERYGNTFSLIMLDIDHFKAVNDTYGHPAGDAVLQWLAGILQRNVRVVDHPARYGGEEFAIIAPELAGTDAFGMAERLRHLVSAHPMPYHTAGGDVVKIPITISLGVASVPGDVDDPHLLVAAADKALYAAKRCGRNCTILFRELEEQLVR